MKTYFGIIGCAVLLLSGICAGSCDNLALAQSPPPSPGSQLPNLKPLTFVNVSLDGVARPVSSFTSTPLPTPEYFVPRSGVAKTLEFRTRDGRGSVQFSHTLPAGVPASAFDWQQASAPSPDAVGRLRYNGCPSCPATFTITVRAADLTSSLSAQVRLNLTASTGRPSLTGITRSGGTDVEPRFEIRFAAGTFDPSDSEVIGLYAGNFRYRLIPENTSNFAAGVMFAVIPRLKLERGVQIFLRNSYGSSSTVTVQLPLQPAEAAPPFECINCSTVLGAARINDAYSIKHTNPGVFEISGTDTITIDPVRTGPVPCNQTDFLYLFARVTWLNSNDQEVPGAGTLTVASQPPANALLRSPDNVVRINWRLQGLKLDHWVQAVFRRVEVLGVCSNRVVQ